MANTNIVHHFLHNGTHVDAPLHFIKDGKSIDSITIEKFIFENPIFLDLPKEKDTFITVDELRNHGFEDADCVFRLILPGNPKIICHFFTQAELVKR